MSLWFILVQALDSKVPRVTKYRPRVLGLIRINVNYCFFLKMSFGCETGNLRILSLSKSTCIHQIGHVSNQLTNSLGELAYFANKNGSQNIAKVDDIPPSISVHKPLQSEFMTKFISGSWLYDQRFLTCQTQCDC